MPDGEHGSGTGDRWHGGKRRPWDGSLTPLGRFSKPFVTGPNPILISYSGEGDGDSEEVVAKPEGKERVGPAIAIGGPGARGGPSTCGGH